MRTLKITIIVFFMIVVSCTTIFAYVIGSDENGIICFTDNIDPINNEFITLDLDFDGNYESYYFNKNGYLERNKYINNFYMNELGQKTDGDSVELVDVGPSAPTIYMIDNVNYYYINRVTSKYTKSWDYDENKKVRVTVQIPEITGINNTIITKANELIASRGLELLKLFCKEEVYKTNTRKVYISIDKFDKKKPHELNFIPTFNDKFYFNFTVVNTNDDNKTTISHIGIVVDTVDDTCYISNTSYQKLNNLSFTDEKETETSKVENDKTYNSRYVDIVNDIREEYLSSLQEYIDNADSYVSDSENKTDNRENLLRMVNNYIKNISSVYNTYMKKAKNYKKAGTIDTETYNKLDLEFKETLEKYKSVLQNSLQGDINSIKEGMNSDMLQG